jgi:hypothetical protein
MMPLSQMLSPVWQKILTLDVATGPKVSSRSASPKVTTMNGQYRTDEDPELLKWVEI